MTKSTARLLGAIIHFLINSAKMASTPYLSQDKRDYITLHKLEEMVSLAINSVMRDEPKEPQSYLAKHFSGVSVHKAAFRQ